MILCELATSAQTVKHTAELPCPKCQELLLITSPVLADWFKEEQKKDPSLHIMQAYRGEKEQERVFKSGASYVGWGKSAHNYQPSFAIDLFFLENGKSKQIPTKYKKMVSRLPASLENGSAIEGLVDWGHFQVKNWKKIAPGYPSGNAVPLKK